MQILSMLKMLASKLRKPVPAVIADPAEKPAPVMVTRTFANGTFEYPAGSDLFVDEAGNLIRTDPKGVLLADLEKIVGRSMGAGSSPQMHALRMPGFPDHGVAATPAPRTSHAVDAPRIKLLSKNDALRLFEMKVRESKALLSHSPEVEIWERDGEHHFYKKAVLRVLPEFIAASALAESLGKSSFQKSMSLKELCVAMHDVFEELDVISYLNVGDAKKHSKKYMKRFSIHIHEIFRVIDILGMDLDLKCHSVKLSAVHGFLFAKYDAFPYYRTKDNYLGVVITKAYLRDATVFNEICALASEANNFRGGNYLNGRCVREYLAQIASEYKKELLMAELEV